MAGGMVDLPTVVRIPPEDVFSRVWMLSLSELVDTFAAIDRVARICKVANPVLRESSALEARQ